MGRGHACVNIRSTGLQDLCVFFFQLDPCSPLLCTVPHTPSSSIMADEDTIVEDLLVVGVKPLIPPAILQDELPSTDAVKRLVSGGRRQANNIIYGSDDRLLVVVGPCSIHDYAGALDYGVYSREGSFVVMFSFLCWVLTSLFYTQPTN